MSKFSILVFLVLVGAIALFAVSNKEVTSVTIPFGEVYEVPKVSLILFSFSFGAVSMLVVFLIRDTVRFVSTYQLQKKQKKEDRMDKLYGQAMNAILANEDIEAKRLLENIIKEDSEHEDSLLRLGDIAMRADKYDDAFAHFRKALGVNPRSFEALFCLANVMDVTNRWHEALGYIEDILDIDGDNLSALYKKREILEKDGIEGKWDELIDLQKNILKRELSEKDRQKEQTALLGYKYEFARESLESEEHERAGKEFRGILKLDKTFIPAYLGLAETMLSSGEVEDAVNSLEKAYEQTPSAIILARIEDILINIGEPSRLIRIYKKALSLAPQDNMLRFFMGKLYYRLEMIDDAFDVLRSIDTADQIPELNQLLGELYLRRQQHDRAIGEFKKALSATTVLRLPYVCGVCGSKSDNWSGRCPQCKNWNTYQFTIYGTASPA